MAVGISPSSTTTTAHFLHRLLRPPPPLLSCILRPNSITTTTTNFTNKAVLSKHQKSTSATLFSFLHSPPTYPLPLLISHSLSTSFNHPLSLDNELEQEEEDGDDEYDDEGDSESERLDLEGNGDFDNEGSLSSNQGVKRNNFSIPNLTVKEKKDLASYAHSLGKKLKSQLVGKSGVTDNVASSFVETLEANELLKIKIHRTCPGELDDVVQRLEESTGSVVVSQIGRTLIVYRPSISKMEAEEKKRQSSRIYVRKETKLKPMSPLQRRIQVPRLSGRGRRGSSRA